MTICLSWLASKHRWFDYVGKLMIDWLIREFMAWHFVALSGCMFMYGGKLSQLSINSQCCRIGEMF